MILIRDGSLFFGDRALFDEINISIQSNQKIGVVGRNGAGKSTLLKIIAGLQSFSDGVLQLEKKKRIAYMPQEMVLASTKNVFDEVCTVFEKFLLMEQELKQVEEQLEKGSSDAETHVERYVHLQEQLLQFDKHKAIERAKSILKGLGFSDAALQQSVDELSVGWRMRVVLAQLLLQDADFYLFDEPTNHLDIVAKEWFLEFLKEGRFGYLLVTHDRYYLEKACPQILELERGHATMYNGSLTYYLEQKEMRRVSALTTRERQDKEISRKMETIERFRASASKAKMAQSMLKQVEKIELTEVEPVLPTINISFPAAVQPGKIVLTVNNVKHSFDGKQLFEHVNFEIARGQKVALIAPNGVGKTTLFKLIQGDYSLQGGAIEFGHNVKPAFFEQDQARVLKASNTVLEEVSESCPTISEQIIRSALGAFLFPGDDTKKKISVLSGGERNRVAMVKVLLQKANLLVLDEPTNHLDMYAQDILLQALKSYQGTILMVCHDHDFIQKLSDCIVELTKDGVESFPESYESYLYIKKQREPKSSDVKKELMSQKRAEHAQSESHKPASSNKELKKLESTIGQLEHELKRITEKFAGLEYGSEQFKKAEKRYQEVQNELTQCLAEWEKLQH